MSGAADYDYIIDLVYERSRIRLHEGKHQLIRARLGKRLRQLQLETMGDYCDYLRQTGDEGEITRLIDVLTTNYTQFLREKDHFEYLVGQALPQWLPGGGRRKVHVWSAACSSGEEPYSLAFYLDQFLPPGRGGDWWIWATDISTRALETAQNAIYPGERLNSVPPPWRRKYFQQGQNQWAGMYRIKPAIRERVEFRQLNLLGSYEAPQDFAVIFCRNVMIYFDRDTQEKLVQRLVRALAPGGYLFLGHSETLNGLTTGLRYLKPSVYQKA